MINYQWFKMTKVLKLLGLLAFGSGLSVVSVAEEVTFHKDIEPILQRSCLLYTSPSPRDTERSRMPSSA